MEILFRIPATKACHEFIHCMANSTSSNDTNCFTDQLFVFVTVAICTIRANSLFHSD